MKSGIGIQMCWRGSPPIKELPQPLSLALFSLSGWISSAISSWEQLVNARGSAPLITYWNITHKLRNILITRLKSAENTYMSPLRAIAQHIFLPNNSLDLCSSVCVCVSLDNYRLQSWQGSMVVCGEALPHSHKPFRQKKSLVNKSHQSGGKKKIKNKDLLNWGSILYFGELLIFFYYFPGLVFLIALVVCPEDGTPKDNCLRLSVCV